MAHLLSGAAGERKREAGEARKRHGPRCYQRRIARPSIQGGKGEESMSKSALFAALLVPAFLLTVAVAEPALAQEKKAAKKAEKAGGKASIKNLVSDDKARAYLVTYKPGEERAVEAGHRVVRALKGG